MGCIPRDTFVVIDAAYRPRNPEEHPVYGVVAGNLETFLAQQRERDRHVPAFVEREFRDSSTALPEPSTAILVGRSSLAELAGPASPTKPAGFLFRYRFRGDDPLHPDAVRQTIRIRGSFAHIEYLDHGLRHFGDARRRVDACRAGSKLGVSNHARGVTLDLPERAPAGVLGWSRSSRRPERAVLMR